MNDTPILTIKKIVMASKNDIAGFRTSQPRQHVLLNTTKRLKDPVSASEHLMRAIFGEGPARSSPHLHRF